MDYLRGRRQPAGRSSLSIGIAAVALAFALAPAAIGLYVDWLWFAETGYRAVFAGVLGTRALVGLVAGAVALAVLTATIRLAMRDFATRPKVIVTRDGPMVFELSAARARAIGSAVAVVLALLFGLYGSTLWREWLL